MRKTISLLLVLVMILSLSGGVTAFAEELGGVDQQLVEQVVDPANATEQSPEQNTENDPAQSPVEDPAENPEQDPAGDPETKTETETGTEPKSETETGEANEETGEPTEPTETEETEESDTEEQSDETELLALDGAEETYAEISGLSDANLNKYIAIVNVGARNAMSIDKQSSGGVGVTIGGTAPNRTCSIENSIGVLVTKVGNDFSFQLNDPPTTSNFVYLGSSGLASTPAAGAQAATYAHWNSEEAEGGVKLYYLDGTTKYYLKSDFKTGTTTSADAGIFVLFTGSTAKYAGGGSSGGQTVDELAPTITTQPTGGKIVTRNTEGTIELTVAAELPSGVTEGNLTYQWTKNGEAIPNATNTTYNASIKESVCGIYTYRCEVTYTDTDDTPHTTTSAPVAVIVYSGYQITTDILMFSDVHQEPQNVADVLGAYMAENSNKLPAFIVASGDYHNGGTEEDPDVIKASLKAIQDMLGGESSPLKVFWLAGNHEKSNVIIEANSPELKKSGLIYKNGMYIYTINYDEIQEESYDGMLASIKEALDDIKSDSGWSVDQPVIFLAHAGLHTLEGSAGGQSYNIDCSDKMVDLLNEYAKTMKIFFFFGHNHSKTNETFFKTADDGSFIYSTHDYDSTSYNRQIALNFTYGQMGYLNKNIGGGETASVMSFGSGGIKLQRIKGTEYSGTAVTVTAPGEKTVPVVGALAQHYDPGATLEATVTGEGDYSYQWYKATAIDLTVAKTEAIRGAMNSSFKPDKDGYYFCRVTRNGNNADNEFATTTVTLVGEAPVEPFADGQYLIVLKDGDKHFAIMSDESGALSLAEVEVRDNKVIGPKSDFYLWDIRTAEKGLTVLNMGSEYYLTRAGGGGGGKSSTLATTKDSSDSNYNTWAYDKDFHNLFILSDKGGKKTYYYPAIKDGELGLGSAGTLGEANIYLMEVTGGDVPAPNTDVNKIPVPNTADNSSAGIWAALALTASAAMTGAVVRKKKTEA